MSQKIAYILKMYPRFSETFIVNEILELERRGLDIRIYSLRKPDDGRFHASLARVKANVVYVPQYPEMEPERIEAAHQVVRDQYPEQYEAVRNYSFARGHEYAIKRFLQAGYIAGHLLKHPVDAMHAHFASSATRAANLVQRLIGLPYSFTAHAKDIYHEDTSIDSLKNKIREARFVVTVSDFNQTYLQEMMENESVDIRRLYNGIDLTHFRPSSNTVKQPDLILGVGRLVEKKGFDVLIHACRRLKSWEIPFRCKIIGKGDLRRQLELLISQLDLKNQVRLVGPRPQNEVLAAYHQASIFTLPCIIGKDGNRDGLPTVLLEAMATGLPAISTSLTGIPEIIDDRQNGILIQPQDVEALANALAELLTNKRRRLAYGIAARNKVEHNFDVRQNVDQLYQWLLEAEGRESRRAYPAETMANPLKPALESWTYLGA